ncbi:uncharacterized protein BcabD6B2_09220 [Babesia caballi]|uniref:Uncharacterized protein n=1 Tax=Babesia caballi TaxID=5871 RepID=A0AAV4LNT6_BABCB|nr:hypothetical protein, conserved [Babesia caballi]
MSRVRRCVRWTSSWSLSHSDRCPEVVARSLWLQWRAAGSARRVFRTCLPGDAEGHSGWVPLSRLYNDHTGAGRKEPSEGLEVGPKQAGSQGINTPNQLLFVARRGLRCQVFDNKLWQDLYERAVELGDEFQPRQWVELVHVFKRIKVRQGGLLEMATRQLLYHLEVLSLEDLSKLALSFAYYRHCPGALFTKIAEVVTTRLQREKMQESPGDPAGEAGCGPDGEGGGKNRALSKITSYTHLLGAFAKCDFAHREMFEAVAADLLVQLRSKEMLIPPGFLVKIYASYARFGYRHVKLFDALAKEVVTAKIPTDQLLQLQRMMQALDYENELMLNVFAYRLGNSGIAVPQRAG